MHGTQGHVAYPHRADNPVHRLVRALAALTAAPLDAGTEWFEPSSLQLTSIDVGNPATNLIPASARAALNIRFNDRHMRHVADRLASRDADAACGAIRPRCIHQRRIVSDQAGRDGGTLRAAIAKETGVEPKLDTGGGTSDARFIAAFCPVAEFGLVGATMHQADERVPVAELRELAGIYRAVLAALLA